MQAHLRVVPSSFGVEMRHKDNSLLMAKNCKLTEEQQEAALKEQSHETGQQSLNSESSQQLCRDYEEFAQMPSHDKFPQEADVTAFVQKRIQDFAKL